MVSIAMATYNGEKYLQQQLQCIATQSVYKNFHGIQTYFDDLSDLQLILKVKKNKKYERYKSVYYSKK